VEPCERLHIRKHKENEGYYDHIQHREILEVVEGTLPCVDSDQLHIDRF
jgi:hypothetical protein